MDEIETIINGGDKKRVGRSQTDRGILIKNATTLTTSTRGLHLHKIRGQKIAGGIFELMMLKRRIDDLEAIKQKEEEVEQKLNEEIIKANESERRLMEELSKAQPGMDTTRTES